MKAVTFTSEKVYISAFLNLPEKLYNKNELSKSRSETLQLLLGEHVLSHYFKVVPFLVLGEDEKALARCIITLYDNEDTAFIGLFECVENEKAAEMLFNAAHSFCKNNNRNIVVGPVDASIWINYRLKCDNFTQPYTGEPYNKNYYSHLFKQAGYYVKTRYVSNVYKKGMKFNSEKAKKRLNEKLEKGYIIKSPTSNELSVVLNDVYFLLTELYKDFPAYKSLSQNEFLKMFKKLSVICDLSMVKLAFLNDELVGFFIAVPNYGRILCGEFNAVKLLQLLIKKRNLREFAVMYVGVKKGHAGLGMAMAELINREVEKRNLKCIGALIQENKATGTYFNEKIDNKLSYELLYKELS